MKNLLKSIFCLLSIFLTNTLFSQCLGGSTGRVDAGYELKNNDICEGEAIGMLNSSEEFGNSNAFYIWNWGDGQIDTIYDLVDTSHVYNFPDLDICDIRTREKKIEVRLDAIVPGCEEHDHFVLKPIYIKLKPKAKFSAPDFVCAPSLEVDFVNNSCSAYETSTYFWNFGDGASGNNSSTEAEPSHIFSGPGTYNVNLTITDECGSSSSTKSIIVYGQPKADVDVSLNPSNGCVPVTIDFTNKSNNYTSLRWKISPKDGWAFADTIYTESSTNNQVIFFQPGIYEVELTASNPCEEDVWMQTIEVFEKPTVQLKKFEPYCEAAAINFCNFTTTTGTVNETKWIITDPSGNQLTITNCNTQSFTIPGIYLVRVEIDGGSCGTVNTQDTFFVQSPDGVTFSDNPATICTSQPPFTLNVFPPEGKWSGSPAINQNTGLFDPSKATPGMTKLTYDPPGDCAKEGEISIEIIKAPSLDLPEVAPQCNSLNYTSNAKIEGAIDDITWCYQLEEGMPNCVTQPTPPLVEFNQGGVHLFYVRIDSECGAISDTIEIEIQTLDDIVITDIPSPVCNTSSPIPLMATPKGGEWTLNGSTIDSIFDPTSLPPGSDAKLIYNFGSSVCEASKEIIVKVEATDPVEVIDNPIICEIESEFTLDFNPKGGIWTGNGIIDSLEGIFNPQITGNGTQLVRYTFEDDNGCRIVKETTVQVEALPEVIEQQKEVSFCETTEDIHLNEVVNLKFTPSSGTLSWTGRGIVNEEEGIFNSFEAIGTGNDPFTLFWKYQLKDCFITDSLIVSVTEKQTAFAGQDTVVCITDEFLQLEGAPNGGQWKESNISNDGLIDLKAAGAGVKTYEYIFSEGTTCEVKDEIIVDIKDLSGVKAGIDVVKCEASEPFQLTGFFPNNGVWTSDNVIISENGMVDPSNLAPDSVYRLTYCISEQNIACTACAEITLTINALPTALFEIDGTTCVGETLVIKNLSENGRLYSWDFGDGIIKTDEVPKHTYNQIGIYNIQLTVTSEAGCIDEYTIPVSVTEPPIVGFAKDKAEGCAVLEVNFTNQSSGTDVSYLWNFGNGDSLTIENPETIDFEQGNTNKTYIVTLAGTNGCGTLTMQDSVTVFPLPIANFGTNVDEGCSPLEIETSNITLGNPESYVWSIDGQFFSTDSMIGNQIFTTSDSTISVYPITLIAENECGIDTLREEITVFPPNVDAFLSIDTTKGCQPLEVEFSNFSTPGAIITWDFGDGNGSTKANTFHTFEEAGIYTIYQFAANCGVDTDSITIEVLPAPQVSFESDDYACLNQEITFTNTSINTLGSNWDFDTGDTSVVNNPTYIFDSIGLYNVTLKGFSSINSCPSIFEKEIEVRDKPAVGFEPSATDGCPPLSLTFNNNSNPNLTFDWDFDDGSGETVFSPTHLFTESKTYTVSLKGTDGFGCFSDSSILNIIVHDMPSSEFTTDKEKYCSRLDSVFIENQSDGADQYLWVFGDGDSSKTKEPFFLIPEPKNYPISLTTTNQFGCKDVEIQEINALESPIADLPERTYRGCSNLRVQFTNLSKFADNYIWDFGDNNTSTEPSPSHIYQNPSKYEAILIARNTNGCPSDTLRTAINVDEVPKSNFELSSNFICGLSTIIETTNTSIGAVDCTWNFGNGETSKDKNPIIAFEQPNEYLISLITANELGCTDTSYQEISANLQPIAELEPTFEQNCENDIITFLNISTGANGWQWNFGDNIQSTEEQPEHHYEDSGTYDIQLIADYNEVCFDTVNMENVLTIFQAPIADFTWIDRGKGYIQFLNSSQNSIDYEWDFGDNEQSTEFEPLHGYENNGTYSIQLTAIHENGCQRIHTNVISPNFFGDVFFPNAFSPLVGVDEVRVFKPKGKGLADFHLQIYSAWGELVYESRALDGEEPAAVWDGFYKGEILPQGAYAWKASWELLKGTKYEKTGSVILLR